MIKHIRNGLIIYTAALLALVALQRPLIYHPSGKYLSPRGAGSQGWRVISNAEALAWWYPAADNKCTIVFAHGSADSINDSVPVALSYIRAGFGFVLLEYPGYPGLEGVTDEHLIRRAVNNEIALLPPQVNKNKLVFMGHSLGAAVALRASFDWPTKGLVLLSPFQSIGKLAQSYFPIFPLRPLIWDRFDNEKAITAIKAPLFMAHGSEDMIVPQEQGQQLFSLAPQPKRAVWTEDGHNDILQDIELRETIQMWMDEQCAG